METNLQVLHNKLLKLLVELDNICVNNNIKYSLFAGTLIGAIRHKGFIPWDDDADVVFERAEYEKFIKVVPEGFLVFRNPWVPRFTYKSDSKIFIDIFVFDKIEEVSKKQKARILKLKFLQGTLKDNITIKKGILGALLSTITFIIGKLLPIHTKLKWYDSIAQGGNSVDYKCVFSSLDQFKYISHVMPVEIVNDYEHVSFEDTQLMIMKGYHIYLNTFYGDYMKLPDENRRIPEHGNLDKI